MVKAKPKDEEESWLWLGVAVAIGGLAFVGRVAADTWSMEGLSYVLGLSDGRRLLWPAGCVVLFWASVVEIVAVAGVTADLLAGRKRSHWVATWLFGHWRVLVWLSRLTTVLVQLLVAGGVWLLDRSPVSGHASPVSPSVQADDLFDDDFEVRDQAA